MLAPSVARVNTFISIVSYTPPGNTSSGACAEYSDMNASPTTLISSALVPKFVVKDLESTSTSKFVIWSAVVSGSSFVVASSKLSVS